MNLPYGDRSDGWYNNRRTCTVLRRYGLKWLVILLGNDLVVKLLYVFVWLMTICSSLDNDE